MRRSSVTWRLIAIDFIPVEEVRVDYAGEHVAGVADSVPDFLMLIASSATGVVHGGLSERNGTILYARVRIVSLVDDGSTHV